MSELSEAAPRVDRSDNRSYYDAFSENYDRGRDVGYHKLIDEQATEIVHRYAPGKDVLEIGCGTGLILEKVAVFARDAQGIDLSEGMLERARERGLAVQRADCTRLPFADASFDVVYSFKVLAHVEKIETALAEMARVTRPGGVIIYDSYNRNSLRYLVKRAFGPRMTSGSFDEGAISTRFWTPQQARENLPPQTRLETSAGIRIAIPHAAVLRVPVLAHALRRLEWRLMDGPLGALGGFWVMVLRKDPA